MRTTKNDRIVYVFFYPDGIPCYVGQGSPKRLESHIRNSSNKRLREIFCNASKNLPYIIIRENLTSSKAIEIERALIRVIGRIDNNAGPLVNRTDGGEGHSGIILSKETREKHSLATKNTWISVSRREKQTAAMRAAHSRPESKARYRAAHDRIEVKEKRSIIATAVQNKPDVKKKNADGVRAAMARPDVKARRQASMRLVMSNPEIKAACIVPFFDPEVRKRQVASSKSAIIGGRWINNGENCLRLRAEDTLPLGWVYGRLWKNK